jgi:hypothetical protein
MFHMYVASVSYGCCKSGSGCCIVVMVVHVCCKLFFPMFHRFFRRMLKVCLFGCFICFTHMLQVFLSGCCVCFTMVSSVFSGVFASVSDTCFKCFIYLQTYVASVASGCFKSRLYVASPFSPSAASPRCLLLL